MANEEDDIALSLPQPPPPAPARREAAIGEAMRRFDGEAPARPEPQKSGSRWSLTNRPQLGILVAASLVAVIGLPLAWVTVSQKTEPAAKMASLDTATPKSFDIAAAPSQPAPAEAESPPPTVVTEPPPPSIAASEREDRATELAMGAPAPEAIKTEAPEAKRSEQFAGALNRAAPVQSSPVVTAPTISAAAPPPPPAMREAAKPQQQAMADAADSIVVTSARRRGKAVPDRGDWNACTIDDPRRSLAACKSLVNPAAKGAKGQAAAYLADGLSFAWQGQTDRAIAAFDQAIAVAPRSSLAYLNRGLAEQRRGDSDRALADLDQAVQFAPGSARPYYHRGIIRREHGDERRAKADFARAVDLDADYEILVDQR